MGHSTKLLRQAMWSHDPARHTLMEDAQGMVSGAIVSALGLYLLGDVGLLTGGVAGLAFLARYVTGLSFGLLFFLINLPFYYFGFRRLGRAFTIKTFLGIAATSVLVDLQHRLVVIADIHPAWAAVLGGTLLGFGLLAMYRHGASLGGIGILAIYLQERFGWRAGLVQLSHDLVVMVLAFLVAPPAIVLYSVLGAVVLNLFMAINHRSDRYIARR